MRLIIISNRLPVSVTYKNNKLQLKDSSGGLVSGLSAYLTKLKKSFPGMEYLWVGWPGVAPAEEHREELTKKLEQKKLVPVYLSDEDIDNFYNGFCNDTIWPLFHYFPSFTEYSEEQWHTYRAANEAFCDAIKAIAKPGDIFWVHDYHLMLLPKMLRDKISDDIAIGFFLHIPFPQFEIFRLLPDKWRKSILNGLLGSDIVGFHTYDYTEYFLGSVQRMLGYEQNYGTVSLGSRHVKVDTFPMGIDFQKFHDAASSPSVQKEKTKLKRTIEHKKVVLSIDRLDYTKGILKRLQGYERFLKKHDEWREKVTLLLVVVPSRTDVERYQEMKRNIDEIVGNINGKFGTVDWTPIIYQFRSVSFDELIALYSSSDIALVTPLRDGMNLIAKEYVASRRDKRGVLILSEMAGAAQELGEAMTINPHHVEEIVEALEEALDIPADEQEKDMVIMQSRLKRYNIVRWADDFVKELQQFTEEQKGEWEDKLIGAYMKGQIAKDFHLARKRLLLLDYDGTLVPFTKFPYLAKPGEDLLALLRQLTKIPDTTVAIISGRDKKTLQQWFKSVDVHLVAEHGIWVKDGKKGWHMLKPFRNDWKEALLPIMRTYADRVPGSFVEEKEFSVAWHYRLANPELALDRAKELTATLVNMTANMEVQVLQGKKLVEVRSTGADKGSASLHFLGLQKYDFILAIGDDTTDEDLFKAMPEYAYTIKVGLGQSAATYIIDSSVDTRSILEQLTKE